MIRFGSQLTFCSPERILKRSFVELDEQDTISGIFSLENGIVESAQTLFYDGILSAEIVSLKQNIIWKQNENSLKDFQYYDFSEIHSFEEIFKTDKPLVLDFGTNSPAKINNILPYLTRALDSFSIFDIIAACSYYPSLLLGKTAGLIERNKAKLILWENVDLIQKRLTIDTSIRQIN